MSNINIPTTNEVGEYLHQFTIIAATYIVFVYMCGVVVGEYVHSLNDSCTKLMGFFVKVSETMYPLMKSRLAQVFGIS